MDDPSEYLDERHAVERERARLFALVRDICDWGNSLNEDVVSNARAEIRRSWARGRLGAAAVVSLTDKQITEMLASGKIEPLPAFHDPFAGGGALPLEAQRLGLDSYASDLNPVAVLMNKAMIELAQPFHGCPPVNSGVEKPELSRAGWHGLSGIAEDVRSYGQWIRNEARRDLGLLYPTVRITSEIVKGRDDLRGYLNCDLEVVAWIWARTVRSPNPAYSHVSVPLITSYVLSSKKGAEAWLEPVLQGDCYLFRVRRGTIPSAANTGTKLSRGANFKCLLSGTPLEPDYIKAEGRAGRMGFRLLAVVCGGDRERVYLEPQEDHERLANQALPDWLPEQPLPDDPRNFWTVQYGLDTFGKLFTHRQAKALGHLSNLIGKVRERVLSDASAQHFSPALSQAAENYADTVSIFLALGLSRCANFNNSLTVWAQTNEKVMFLFNRQTVPMVWMFGEANLLGDVVGGFTTCCNYIASCIEQLCWDGGRGVAVLADAQSQEISRNKIVSTDPPYYDNIAYADLSDFFYVWLRHALKPVIPGIFGTLTAPKDAELVAAPYRRGGKDAAETFFLAGMTKAISRLAELAAAEFPITIYYAFRQNERDADGLASTGWETFLEAVIGAGLAVCGTWPVRTESLIALKKDINALASSIVLVCRPRSLVYGMTTRRDFQAQLRRELPEALHNLQQGNIAPVDLAQSSIGPGMAIFSRYSKVVEADGSPMKVRTALALINEALDEILAEQEGELDADSRWAIAWFSQFGFGEGPFGDANVLCSAKGTAVDGLIRTGIVYAKAGKVNLLRRDEMDAAWDPVADSRLSVWEATQHLIRRLENDGEAAAAALLANLGGVAEQARDLAYRLYNTCERKGWADEARSYNGLVIAWPELTRLAAQGPARPGVAQSEMTFEEE